MASILKFGKRVQKTSENPQGWVEIYTFHRGVKTNDTLLGHKSVICLPGDGVIYDDEMNGCCKNVEYMLEKSGIAPQDMPQVYSLGFDADTLGHRRKILDKEGLTRYGLPKPVDVRKYWTPFWDTHEYWKPFFNTYILPLIQSSDGKSLPINEVVKNFQNITFVSHCHGGMVAHQIEETLSEKLKELYPGQEKELLSNLRMLHLSSRKPLGKNSGIKHVNVVSLADDLYADYGMLSEDNFYKMLHKQRMESRTAIIPVSDNEVVTVFREVATPKTYGENRNDHSQMLQLVAGRGNKAETDFEAKANEKGLQFIRDILRYFVDHPEDKATIKEIMKKINSPFFVTNLNEGQRLISNIKKENHFNKSLLDFLAQNTVGKVSGDPHFYLQRMQNGQYFYDYVKKEAFKSGNFISLQSVLKKVNGWIDGDVKEDDIREAIKHKNWKLVDILTENMLPKDISKYVLSSAVPEDLPHLYREIRRAKLSSNSQWNLIDSLLEKSHKIRNSAGRVKVQSFLKQEKAQREKAKGIVRVVQREDR